MGSETAGNPQNANDMAASASPAEPAAAGYERPKATVRPHDLAPLNPASGAVEAGNMDLLLDVSVPVIAQLGSTEMRIRDILRLTPGSVVALDKLAGEPVDLFVRGQLFAQGEVVIVDESFGIRVTKIVSRNETEK